ncbi:MAG: hypothetical protein ACI4KM_04285 [Oscillospiraceae bacterium]
MLKKITAVILGAAIAAASCISTVSAAEPVVTETVERVSNAVNVEWNGKTALKSGSTYVVNKSVTVSKKITVPEGTTLTVKKGGKITVASGGSLYVKGKLTVASGASVTVNGKLYLYKGKKLNISGSLKFGKTAAVTLKGETTVYVGGKISGTPKTVTVSDSAKVTVKGTNSCSRLVKAIDKRDIKALYQNYYTKILIDNDSLTAFLDSYPSDYIKLVEDTLADAGVTFSDFCDVMNAEIKESQPDIKSMTIELTKYTDKTGKIDAEIKPLLEQGYGKVSKVAEVELKVTITTRLGADIAENITAVAAYSGGRWYLVDWVE